MFKDKQQKILVIVGPTASGKSDLAIKLAKKYNAEIISADSRQVYHGMNIGTGKVTKKEQKIIKHHLIDVVSPKKIFTADDFKKLGQKVLIDLASQSKLPIIVGGAGLYIDVLLGRVHIPEITPNPKLRRRLEKLPVEHLFKMLKKLDPQRAKTIESKNKRRLVRALEIVESIGKVPSLNTKHKILDTKYNILWIGLRPDNLQKKIKIRLEKRLKQGMIKEVKKLHARGVSWKRLHDLGLEYRWIAKYLRKEINYKDMKEGLLKDIIKYSKRQMTWFKRNKEIKWFPSPQAFLRQATGLLATALRE